MKIVQFIRIFTLSVIVFVACTMGMLATESSRFLGGVVHD